MIFPKANRRRRGKLWVNLRAQRERNAELIANCPIDIARLLAVVEVQAKALKFYAQWPKEFEWEGNEIIPGMRAREAQAEVMKILGGDG